MIDFSRRYRIRESPFGGEPREAANIRDPGASAGAKGETLSVYFNDHNVHLLEIITYE